MMQYDRAELPAHHDEIRREVRAFLKQSFPPERRANSDFTSGHNPAFSEQLGDKGWIGMTWPARYGGGEKTFFERYVVTEELLAAGAPVSAHWIADRQSGPLLLRYGSQAQRERYLPDITAGKSYFSIGMSEPGSGSDLASVRTSAVRGDGGWVINGTKLWSTDAHRNHFMIALVRTRPISDNRHAGLSQFVIDLRRDDVAVRPILNMGGQEDFNEVVFEDTFVPDDRMVGEEGNGWEQVTSELSYERSGPERFLSAFRVYVELVRAVGTEPSDAQAATIGRLAAHFLTLRRMSISVAGMLESGGNPVVEAALVKELGNNFEKELPDIARAALAGGARPAAFEAAYQDTMLGSPAFTLRGGTREILRGVIARGLGLR